MSSKVKGKSVRSRKRKSPRYDRTVATKTDVRSKKTLKARQKVELSASELAEDRLLRAFEEQIASERLAQLSTGEWLAQCGLSKLQPLFAKECITVDNCIWLHSDGQLEDWFAEMSLGVMDRMKLKRGIADMAEARAKLKKPEDVATVKPHTTASPSMPIAPVPTFGVPIESGHSSPHIKSRSHVKAPRATAQISPQKQNYYSLSSDESSADGTHRRRKRSDSMGPPKKSPPLKGKAATDTRTPQRGRSRGRKRKVGSKFRHRTTASDSLLRAKSVPRDRRKAKTKGTTKKPLSSAKMSTVAVATGRRCEEERAATPTPTLPMSSTPYTPELCAGDPSKILLTTAAHSKSPPELYSAPPMWSMPPSAFGFGERTSPKKSRVRTPESSSSTNWGLVSPDTVRRRSIGRMYTVAPDLLAKAGASKALALIDDDNGSADDSSEEEDATDESAAELKSDSSSESAAKQVSKPSAKWRKSRTKQSKHIDSAEDSTYEMGEMPTARKRGRKRRAAKRGKHVMRSLSVTGKTLREKVHESVSEMHERHVKAKQKKAANSKAKVSATKTKLVKDKCDDSSATAVGSVLKAKGRSHFASPLLPPLKIALPQLAEDSDSSSAFAFIKKKKKKAVAMTPKPRVKRGLRAKKRDGSSSSVEQLQRRRRGKVHSRAATMTPTPKKRKMGAGKKARQSPKTPKTPTTKAASVKLEGGSSSLASRSMSSLKVKKKRWAKGKKKTELSSEDSMAMHLLRRRLQRNERIVRVVMRYRNELKRVIVLPPLHTIERNYQFENAVFDALNLSRLRDFSDLTVSYPLSWDGALAFPIGSTPENADYFFSVRLSYCLMNTCKVYIKEKLNNIQWRFFSEEIRDYYNMTLADCNHESINYFE